MISGGGEKWIWQKEIAEVPETVEILDQNDRISLRIGRNKGAAVCVQGEEVFLMLEHPRTSEKERSCLGENEKNIENILLDFRDFLYTKCDEELEECGVIQAAASLYEALCGHVS